MKTKNAKSTKLTAPKEATAPVVEKIEPIAASVKSDAAKPKRTKRATAAATAPKETPPVELPPVVTVVVKLNVGWGNRLFIRGKGDGLSWEKGVPLTCINPGEWVWISEPLVPALDFKIVLNDLFWELGDNHAAALGDTIVVTPTF